MKVLIWIPLLLLLFSCRENSAPDFADARGDAMLKAFEAIVDGKEQDAVQILRELERQEGNDAFLVEAMLTTKRRQHLKKLSEYLKTMDYEGMQAFLNDLELKGEAGPEILEYNQLPGALQELSLYKAKMPWEEPRPMKEALVRLSQYKVILDKSPAFRKFYGEQEKHLRSLENAKAISANGL